MMDLEPTTLKKVTMIYYNDNSLELEHQVKIFTCKKNGRVVIPAKFKVNKSIIAVCEGNVNILNKVGERILPLYRQSQVSQQVC